MKAAHVAEYYTAYLEGSLPKDLRQEVARHLEACPQCAAELEEMRLLVTGLHELPEMPAPANFAAGVRARLDARRPARPWFLRVPVLAGGTLAAAALVLAIIIAPNLQAPRETMVASQPKSTAENAWKDTTPNADTELKARGFATKPPTTAAAPTPAAPVPVPDPFAHGNGDMRMEKAPMTAPASPSPADQPGAGSKLQSRFYLDSSNGSAFKLDNSKDKRLEFDERSPGIADPTPSMKPESRVDEPAPTMMAKLPPATAEDETPAPVTSTAGTTGPAGPAGTPGATRPDEAKSSADYTRSSTTPAGGTDGAAGNLHMNDQALTMADASGNGGGRQFDSDLRLQSVESGALVLRSAVVKGAEATVTVETMAPAPTGLMLLPVEPTRGKTRSYPLSATARTATFTLPLQRGGSVFELTVNAGNATTQAYLAAPDTGVRKTSFTLNVKKAPMLDALRQLAVAGKLFILCPAPLAEKQDITFTARGAQPIPALSELAFQHGHQAVIIGNVVILIPKTQIP